MSHRTRRCALPLLGALLAMPVSTVAQPARNGNVFNGTAHEPAAGAVQRGESATGVAPSQQRAEQQNRDLDAVGRQLMDKAKREGAQPPPMPRPPNATGR